MKKLILIALLSCISAVYYAQSPAKFNYQAVARDASGEVIANQNVSVRISILSGSSTGTTEYAEEHAVGTNGFGLFNFKIGEGASPTGDLTTIDWSSDDFFIKVEFDGDGGTNFSDLSTSQLVSVPFSLFANDVLNDDVDDADADPANELQSLSISNDTIFLSDGGSVQLPEGFDGQYSSLTGAPTNISAFTNDAGYLTSFTEVDGSITNEIQVLSISNDTVYLTDGGFVQLPEGFDGQYSSLTGAPTNVSAFTNDAGYLTSFTEVDGSVTNEIQAVSFSNDTLYLSEGGSVYLGDYINASNYDNDSTNEVQVISISNDTIFLSDGGFAVLPAGFDGQYSSLTGTPTNVSSFTNDAGYLVAEVDGDSANELQTLSISNDTLRLTDGGEVVLPSSTGGGSSVWNDSITNVNTPKTVGIGTSTPDTNASLELQVKPFLPTRMNTEQLIEISNPATGMMVFNTDNNCPYFFGDDTWESACRKGGVSLKPGEYSAVAAPIDPGAPAYSTVHQIDVHNNGHYAVLGQMAGTLQIGNTPVSASDNTLLYFDKEDNLIWHETSLPLGLNYTTGMAMDTSGNVYMAGSFNTSFTIDSTTVNPVGEYDIFLAKFSSTGNLMYIETYGAANADIFEGMTVDVSGNVYIYGYYRISTTIGSLNHTSSGGSGQDGLFFKTNSSGVVQWSHSTGGNHIYDQIQSLDVDANENVYLIYRGNNSGSVFLNGSFYTAANGYIAKMNSGATSVSWLLPINDKAASSNLSVSPDGSSIYLDVYSPNSSTFGVGVYSQSINGSSNSRRTYLFHLNGNNGTVNWFKYFTHGLVEDIKVTNTNVWVSGRKASSGYSIMYESTTIQAYQNGGTFLTSLASNGTFNKGIYAHTEGSAMYSSNIGLSASGYVFQGVYSSDNMNVNGQTVEATSNRLAVIKSKE